MQTPPAFLQCFTYPSTVSADARCDSYTMEKGYTCSILADGKISQGVVDMDGNCHIVPSTQNLRNRT